MRRRHLIVSYAIVYTVWTEQSRRTEKKIRMYATCRKIKVNGMMGMGKFWKKKTLDDVILPGKIHQGHACCVVCVSAMWSAVLSAHARAVWSGAMVLCCRVCANVSSVEMGFWVCGFGGGSSRARYCLQVRGAKKGGRLGCNTSRATTFIGCGYDSRVSHVLCALPGYVPEYRQ